MNDQDLNIKKRVRQFYDEVGWGKNEEGLFADAVLYEDLREVVRDYISKCHLRVKRYLPESGTYLMDVASGPLQYAEYLTYGQNFTYRLCVDLSWVALQEARAKLGDKGLYVIADLANLPFKTDKIDAIISLHTLYHLPDAEQAQACREIGRVLKPRGKAVIVYNWGRHARLMNLLTWPLKLAAFPGRVARYVRRRLAPDKKAAPTGPYFHAHPLRWFEMNIKPAMPYSIYVWRSVSVAFLRGYIHAALGGKSLLKVIYRLEERFPQLLGKWGQYPLFVVHKP